MTAMAMDPTVNATELSGPIVAGRFETFDDAEAAKSQLVAAGFPASGVSVFFNNPPGRHDLTEIGGDEHADPEAKQAAGGLGVESARTMPADVVYNRLTKQPYQYDLVGHISSNDPNEFMPPVAAGGNIYFITLVDGAVTVIEGGQAQPRVVAKNEPLGERVAASPAIADDTLYIRTSGHLYAFAAADDERE